MAARTTGSKARRSAARARKNMPARFEDLPNVGKAMAGDLRLLGFRAPADLVGRDPYALYDALSRTTGVRQDPCVLDTFLAVVRYVEGGPKKPWWAFTAERKRTLAERGARQADPGRRIHAQSSRRPDA